MTALTLTRADIEDAAKALRCDVPAILAILDVESEGRGFDDGRPLILPEPHKFSKFTRGRFDKNYPKLSYPRRGTFPYPRTQTARWEQLEQMIALDHEAALLSTSWGLFQIMGFNHQAAGYSTVFRYVDAMGESELKQLQAFVHLIFDWKIDNLIREHRWGEFENRYNGGGQNGAYARRLAKRHAFHVSAAH